MKSAGTGHLGMKIISRHSNTVVPILKTALCQDKSVETSRNEPTIKGSLPSNQIRRQSLKIEKNNIDW